MYMLLICNKSCAHPTSSSGQNQLKTKKKNVATGNGVTEQYFSDFRYRSIIYFCLKYSS